MATETHYTESGSSPPLQYFPFTTPQKITVYRKGRETSHMALGYWMVMHPPELGHGSEIIYVTTEGDVDAWDDAIACVEEVQS